MYLVKSKWIVSSNNKVIEDGGILIDKGKIKKVLEDISETNSLANIEIIDYEDSILMPSFTNAHTHLYGILSWGIPKLDNFNDFEGF